MKPKINTKHRQILDDASIELHSTLNGLQSKSNFPNFIWIKNKGESPPGRSRSSGSSQCLHPDINSTACKGNIINNKEEINNNKSKANFI